jgi:FHS family L-fucose permease-like MFS transporter
MALSNHSPNGAKLIPSGVLVPFILVTALFMFWAVPHNLNDVLIKQFMKSFEMSRLKAGFIQSAFYLGYFAVSLPAALVMKKYGYKTGLVIGLFVYSIGTFLFWPAAKVGVYGFFLFALFVIASGLAFLETGANPFIARIGHPDTSERRLNFSQAFNPFGALLGALIGTIFIFSGIEPDQAKIDAMKAAGEYETFLRVETMRVIKPYMVLCGVMIVWALLIIRTKFPVIAEEADTSGKPEQKGSWKVLFKYPHFVQGVIAQFFYVGAQVGTWSYFIQYIQDYTGLPEKVAGYFLTGTRAAFLVGRFSATYLMKFIRPSRLMGFYSIMNVALLITGITFPGWVGLWAVFLTSFFMSLMFPTIFAMGIKGLGPHTKIGGSIIIMSIIGGAVFTPIMGLVFQLTKSMALAMIVPLTSYIFIVYYSYVGSKVRGPVYADSENTGMIPSH